MSEKQAQRAGIDAEDATGGGGGRGKKGGKKGKKVLVQWG